jgi:hypothetical protein
MIVIVGLSDGTEAGEEKRMTQMTGGKKCEGNTEELMNSIEEAV